MHLKNYKKLQNGSDIRGVAMEGVENEQVNLTPDTAQDLSSGFAGWLTRKTGKPATKLTVAIGRDPRLSGEALLFSAAKALASHGIRVLDCGLASTPAMFMSTVFEEYNCDGAIMITASHLPFNRNGFKYFSKDGGLNKIDITEIINFAEQAEIILDSLDEPEKCELMETYCAHLRKLICEGTGSERPLENLKIAVDAGNGSGGFYAEKVLAPLGADVSASRYLDPDGRFSNHAPNPENKEAMAAISDAVISSGSDFGLIFDTDVDRSAAVDKNGRKISRNRIVALAAALIAESSPGSTVVTDSITSDQLTVFLEKNLGLKHLRFKRGYKNVINMAIELNANGVDCALAIETSGHAAIRENFFLDDGAYLATQIVIKAAQLAVERNTIDSLIADLEEAKEAIEVRFPIMAEDFSGYGDEVLSAIKLWASQNDGLSLVEPNYEGVRIRFDSNSGNGWCLLRKSLHDPIMPLNIESDDEGGCLYIAKKLLPCLSQFNKLDISALR
ncbi:MAG: phosphomannomutase/phosphoglucomutase [Eubacteriales bacterium]|nr:phosphomannomutase/phosphoglucomutase [Eubacteriales bacterium]MDD4390482.1 phosphomannomutase/phosphoglucomutase [Eubacteriales bacterium]